jgi:hypothetical protein
MTEKLLLATWWEDLLNVRYNNSHHCSGYDTFPLFTVGQNYLTHIARLDRSHGLSYHVTQNFRSMYFILMSSFVSNPQPNKHFIAIQLTHCH